MKKEERRETEGERERRKEGERARERERRKSAGERGTRVLKSIHLETDLRNPSQPTDTQNWDSVIVSSVRCTLKRREFVKGNPRIDFTLTFTSALDNINYTYKSKIIYNPSKKYRQHKEEIKFDLKTYTIDITRQK